MPIKTPAIPPPPSVLICGKRKWSKETEARIVGPPSTKCTPDGRALRSLGRESCSMKIVESEEDVISSACMFKKVNIRNTVNML